MNYDVVIIGGMGHVGFPLGLVWADAGLTVGALDLDEAKKKLVNAGTMPFLEHGAEPILQRVIAKKFFVLNHLPNRQIKLLRVFKMRPERGSWSHAPKVKLNFVKDLDWKQKSTSYHKVTSSIPV